MPALAAPLSVAAIHDGVVVGATKTPSVHVWPLHDGAARTFPVTGPRLSSVCLHGEALWMATDWAATVERWSLESASRVEVVASGEARVTKVSCRGEQLAMLAFPAVAGDDPEAAGTGPGVAVWLPSKARYAPPAGVSALQLTASGLWMATGDGSVVRWTEPSQAAEPVGQVAVLGAPRAIAVDGEAVWVSSGETLCVLDGLCTAVDGGAGTLAVGPQTVAVGGFSEVTLLDKKTGAVRGQLPGRAVGLSTHDDGFVVVLGREVVWTAADGRVIRRSPLTVR